MLSEIDEGVSFITEPKTLFVFWFHETILSFGEPGPRSGIQPATAKPTYNDFEATRDVGVSGTPGPTPTSIFFVHLNTTCMYSTKSIPGEVRLNLDVRF